ncbi:MAG: PrsW family intramembrane metalloprotease [Dehalococcoidales bacterium]|nr:PrsW family intramembrane metalloprotease [Dehalococcoidales bacterium]
MKFIKQPWLQILVIGIILFAGAEEALRATGNPNFFPTVIILGASVIPVTFAAYFYKHVKRRELSLPLLTSSFVIGGISGLLIAGFIEFHVAQGVNVFNQFKIGLIEEAVKLIFPFILFVSDRYRHEADGLIFGVAMGMGFAAFETMSYGMMACYQSGGSIDVIWQIFLVRGLVSPAVHASWTGFLCAVIWRERERKAHSSLNFNTNIAFLLVIILHSLWNIINSINAENNTQFALVILGNVVIAAVSVTLLILRYREARKSLLKEQVE